VSRTERKAVSKNAQQLGSLQLIRESVRIESNLCSHLDLLFSFQVTPLVRLPSEQAERQHWTSSKIRIMAQEQACRHTQRYKDAVAAFLREASKDPTLVQPVQQAKATIDGSAAGAPTGPVASTSKVPYSLVYHQTLAAYVEQLSCQST
jgi:hypothetical protein